MDVARVSALLDRAAAQRRTHLLDTEGLDLLRALGLDAPAHIFVAPDEPVTGAALASLDGARAVVKVVSPRILHKTDVGGVAIVEKTPAAVTAAIAAMRARLGDREVVGYTINEFVAYPQAFGHELIVGLRWTDDVGPVVSVGTGGVYTEFLSRHFRPGLDIAVVAPGLTTPEAIAAALDEVAVVQLVTRPQRGQPARLALPSLVAVVETFLALAASHGDRIAECEVNPLVVDDRGRLRALDILVALAGPRPCPAPPRPLAKLDRLLRPRSAAIMGVSERLNPGRIIVNNLLREGFGADRVTIVKPGPAELEGCRCVPDIASLGAPVDLFVLAVDAAQASQAILDIVERQASESIILIPGGLEEKAGSEALVAPMRAALARARATPWGGPVINGGNCLGIRSLPGRYDTTFIPEHKFPVPTGAPSRLALISQSGAFALSTASRLGVLNPRYSVTLGNQMDLTVGDYVTWLAQDPDVDVFAVYVEGFRPLDGRAFLQAARRIVDSGRTVILYRAGRTPAGAKASASHTASIAGDYAVIRALSRAAGVIVADSLEDFADLTALFTLLGPASIAGWRLAAVSNAGFECVAIADNLGQFTLPAFNAATRARLETVFADNRIARVVDVNNPLDLTPMTGDAGYVQTVEAIAADPDIDAVLVGCVPFTAALQTLPPGDCHNENLAGSGTLVSGLIDLQRRQAKPLVAVIAAGPLYDPMAQALLAAGIPTFRSADRALRLLNVYGAARLRARGTGA